MCESVSIVSLVSFICLFFIDFSLCIFNLFSAKKACSFVSEFISHKVHTAKDWPVEALLEYTLCCRVCDAVEAAAKTAKKTRQKLKLIVHGAVR